jgi:hypothetical protein
VHRRVWTVLDAELAPSPSPITLAFPVELRCALDELWAVWWSDDPGAFVELAGSETAPVQLPGTGVGPVRLRSVLTGALRVPLPCALAQGTLWVRATRPAGAAPIRVFLSIDGVIK